ncbi:MAG: hypothetical protein IJU71_10175 [Selenomonadaceae bacterium]|nr:hypothetical protein [Selenomonadaceae bacterium]
MKFLLSALMATALMIGSMTSVRAEIYQQGIVYVNYEREGEAAVIATDVDNNGVPDVVEDIATQINAARAVFHDEFGFPDPLGSARYKNVKTIEVDICAKKDMNNKNGLAFSGVRKKSKHNPNESALHIKIASTVDPHKNSTPTHEYFHLIQYGATYFRNGWYLEGMARWSQDAVQEIKKYPTDKNLSWTLKDKASEAKIFAGKYGVAKLLWYPLSVDLKDKQKISSKLIKKYRYVDGAAVFKDNVFYGPNVMKRVLASMKSVEDEAANEFGGRKKWIKDGVRNAQNNKYILKCVRDIYNERK